ncbi:UNVERIFIED_CONTAM: hypothetical protein Scaly_1835200 [Sesamum calycinum]|uniref:DUF4283 domain-containing protein n=1 Tax=Sesamum calycinum TaxID=2727403 RepID=A0AAW2NGS5_9LAMI
MTNSTGRLDSANGAPPATAPFCLNSADFPPLTRKSATHSESTQPDSTQAPNRSFAEAIFSPSARRQNSQRTETQELQKFFLADFSPASIGSINNINGRTTLIFSNAETQSLADDFKFALIGKFSHGSPPYSQLHRLIAKSGIKGAFTVSLINNKHALISLSNESDYTRLWLRRIWTLNGFSMRVFKWSPTFTSDHESSIVPIWVSLPELPAHLFRKDALFAIARNIGMPLQIADSTLNQSNLANARVCVEIDLLKPLLKEIDIQICGSTIVQSIVYEHIPSYCSLCKHVGHLDADCYSKGNAPKPPPNRRHAGKKNVSADHKLKEKTMAVYKVLDKKPSKNPIVTEAGECSKTAEERHRYASVDLEHNFHNDAENEIVHSSLDGENVGVRMVYVENEVVVHANSISSLAGNNISSAENENAFGDVACNAENEAVITCYKGDANGLHVVDDASINVGDDDVNEILCVENDNVIEETEMVERKEAEILGKEDEIVEKNVGIITTRPNLLGWGWSCRWAGPVMGSLAVLSLLGWCFAGCSWTLGLGWSCGWCWAAGPAVLRVWAGSGVLGLNFEGGLLSWTALLVLGRACPLGWTDEDGLGASAGLTLGPLKMGCCDC